MVDLHEVKDDVVDIPAALHVSLGVELGHRLADPGTEGRLSGQGLVIHVKRMNTILISTSHIQCIQCVLFPLQCRVVGETTCNITKGAPAENTFSFDVSNEACYFYITKDAEGKFNCLSCHYGPDNIWHTYAPIRCHPSPPCCQTIVVRTWNETIFYMHRNISRLWCGHFFQFYQHFSLHSSGFL